MNSNLHTSPSLAPSWFLSACASAVLAGMALACSPEAAPAPTVPKTEATTHAAKSPESSTPAPSNVSSTSTAAKPESAKPTDASSTASYANAPTSPESKAAPAKPAVAVDSAPSKSTPAAADYASIDEMIAKGRALLAAGKATEAQTVFEAAEKLDGSTIKTRMWTLRSWLPQGRINDTLNEIDKLDRAGAKGPDLDYLFGMAFAFQGRSRLAEGGVATSTAGMAFTDAYTFLSSATKADATKYADAFGPLAEAAYQSLKFDDARAAADKACALAPDDADAFALLGKIAFQQYVAATGDEALRAGADAHLSASITANRRALELMTAKGPAADKAKLQAVHLDIGMAFAWRRNADEVAREFAAAIALDPNKVDMMTLKGLVDGAAFLPALENGTKGWREAGGTDVATANSLQWWLGYAQYDAKKYAESEATFLDVAGKTQFYNSWWYVALARYQQQKHEKAIEALRKNWELDAGNLVASINGNREFGMMILNGLIAWCANNQKNLDAAFLSEVQTAVAPEWAPYWNNMGLFYRDAGDVIARSKKAKDDEALRSQAKALWEKSLVAYEKSVELSPDDPNYLNDLAVVLHYNLHRDLERAKTLYEKSQKRAVEELARKDLSAADRGFREIAARDSKNNLKLLEEEMEKARKKAEGGASGEPAKKEPPADGPAPK